MASASDFCAGEVQREDERIGGRLTEMGISRLTGLRDRGDIALEALSTGGQAGAPGSPLGPPDYARLEEIAKIALESAAATLPAYGDPTRNHGGETPGDGVRGKWKKSGGESHGTLALTRTESHAADPLAINDLPTHLGDAQHLPIVIPWAHGFIGESKLNHVMISAADSTGSQPPEHNS